MTLKENEETKPLIISLVKIISVPAMVTGRVQSLLVGEEEAGDGYF